MERYTLSQLYLEQATFVSAVKGYISANSNLIMGLNLLVYGEVVNFICSAVWGYFYDDIVAYNYEQAEDLSTITNRISYDIAIKLPYYYKKYQQIKKLLTTSDISLLQSSKMTSSSSDTTKSAGGSLQKGATTPTGVSATTSTDAIDITIGTGTSDGDNDIETTGFVDKYTNHQQKFANASRIEGSRSGTITREGSIDELLKVLEKLPSSFADEVTKDLQKHFIFDYDGVEKGLYENE
jgi:hypothetical protein